MCGISGYLDLTSGLCLETLQKMNDVIYHRGPDDEGYLLINEHDMVPCSGRDTLDELGLPSVNQMDGRRYFLGFGHRRLSILDPSPNGHQPMFLAERGIAVTYNGEIYNYLEVREELERLGYTFQTNCDTEVLLYAYCEWGEDCLLHFNGMWGFALWDSKEGKLFCARDRLGAKPFHYWRQGNRMLFGSELKQLCQDDSTPRQFNRRSLAASLIYGMSDYDEQTWIEGFFNLRPGCKLIVKLSTNRQEIKTFRVEPYWELKAGFRYDIPIEEWKERLAAEFSRSCRWRLRSDVPVAAMLSGGLDSSCLVTEVCDQLSDPSQFHTFTTQFPDEDGQRECNEYRYAEMVNRHCGCQGHPVLINPNQNIVELYEKQLWTAEGYSPWGIFGSALVFEEIQKYGFKVILNGQCGDETLFGYTWYMMRYILDQLRSGHFFRGIKLLSQYQGLSGFTKLRTLQSLFYYNVPYVRNMKKYMNARTFISENVLKERHWEFLRPLLCPNSCEQLQITGLTAISLPSIIRFDDRQYMAYSMESRLPFMDYRFVELAVQIPPAFKVKDGYSKYIMREIFDDRMPKEVTWRGDKLGFSMPVDVWKHRIPKAYLQDLVVNAKSADYFKMNYLKTLVERNSVPRELLQFLNVELFARKFGVT